MSHWPAIEPSTTTSSAAKSTLTPSRWPCGSLPPTAGAMYRPAASHAVAIHSTPNCVCQVREGGPGEIERLALPGLPWAGGQFRRLQIMLRITGSCEVREIALEARPVGGDPVHDQTSCAAPRDLRRVPADRWDDLSYDAVAAKNATADCAD